MMDSALGSIHTAYFTLPAPSLRHTRVGNPQKNSWPCIWEGTGGGVELQDRTLLETMVCKTYGEFGLQGWCTANRVYRFKFSHEGYQMAKYIFIMRIHQKINCQRLWSDELQQPLGCDKILIQLKPDERLNYLIAKTKRTKAL